MFPSSTLRLVNCIRVWVTSEADPMWPPASSSIRLTLVTRFKSHSSFQMFLPWSNDVNRRSQANVVENQQNIDVGPIHVPPPTPSPPSLLFLSILLLLNLLLLLLRLYGSLPSSISVKSMSETSRQPISFLLIPQLHTLSFSFSSRFVSSSLSILQIVFLQFQVNLLALISCSLSFSRSSASAWSSSLKLQT